MLPAILAVVERISRAPAIAISGDANVGDLPGWGLRSIVPVHPDHRASIAEAIRGAGSVFALLPTADSAERNAFNETLNAVSDVNEVREFGALLPARFLSSQRFRSTREELAAHWYPKIIVEAEAVQFLGSDEADALLRGDTGAAFVWFGRLPEADAPTIFYTVGFDESASDVAENLQRLLSRRLGHSGNGWVFEDRIDAAVSLKPARYSPETTRIRRGLADYGEIARVVDMVETVPSTAIDDQPSFLERAVPVLQGREIDRGHIKPVRDRLFAAPTEAERLRAGDVCIRRAVSSNDSRLSLLVVERHDLPMAADDSVIVLRFRTTFPEDGLHSFVTEFLRSPTALKLLRPGPEPFLLDPLEVLDSEVPLPAPPLRVALLEMQRCERLAADWIHEARRVRARLADTTERPTGEAVVEALASIRKITHRITAGEEMDDLSARLRRRLPYPLAHLWRAVETGGDDLADYARLLETGETVTAYIAAAGLCGAIWAGQSLKSVTEIRGRIEGGQGGLGFGEWSSIVAELQGTTFRHAVGDAYPIPEILGAFDPSSDAGAALGVIRDRRNDFAHQRGPRMALARHIPALRQEVLTILEAVEFLGDYPLRVVEQGQWDSATGIGTYYFRDFMGDHPLVRRESAETDRSDLEHGSVYLVAQGQLLLMRPLLLRWDCEDCGLTSFFQLDAVLADRCRFRSSEDEHQPVIEGLDAALRRLGL